MSAISLQRPDFPRNLSYRIRVHHKISASWTIVSCKFTPAGKEKELSEELQKLSIPEMDKFSHLSIKFDRLQRPDQESNRGDRAEFGQFVACEARIDEEYRTAAWLRAETHCEDGKHGRYADNHKRKFAEQEFNALKTRCKVHLGEKCTCIVMVTKEDETVKRSIVKSVVGTLDLSIGYLSLGERFPGAPAVFDICSYLQSIYSVLTKNSLFFSQEQVKAPPFCLIDRKASSKYGYIANLCVAKPARRKGIARNMLQFAILHAQKQGTEHVFVHVHRSNKAAQCLYQKLGFKVIAAASSDQIYLLSLETINDVRVPFSDDSV